MVKSNMAAERGLTHLTSCNSLSTLSRVTNLVNLPRFSGSRSQMKQFFIITVYYLIPPRPTPVAMATKFEKK